MIVIDLDRYTPPKGLLHGKQKGTAIWVEYERYYKKSKSASIILRAQKVIATESLYLGLFYSMFKECGSKTELLKRVDYSDLSHSNRSDFLRGINRISSLLKNKKS